MFNQELPKTAAVYCRVSSEAQQERQTIESQLEFAQKYCELNGIEITEIYRDDGITGTLPLQDRPAGGRMLADAKAERFTLLLIFKLDRLGRSTRVILNAVHDLDEMRVKVRSMTEPFDTSDASGRFLLTILAGVADLERSNILQRMELGAVRAAKEGKWLGGIVPYGYIKNKDKYLEINEQKIPGFDLSEPDVVRMMFHMCADKRASTIKIADHLNALGIPPAWVAHGLGGKRRNNTRGIWTQSRILRILRSSTYKGIHQYGKRSQKERELIERQVPAIVDADIWGKVQNVLTGNQIDAVKNSKHVYLLKSLIKCAECGSTYRGNPGYYSCGGRSNWKRMGRSERCTGMSINMEWLDNFVWQNCLRYINNPHLVVKALDESQNDTDMTAQRIDILGKRLIELAGEREQMLELYRQKIITVKDLTAQLGKLEQETSEAKTELDKLKADAADNNQLFAIKETALNMLELLQKSANKPDITIELKQTIIKTMVNKILVDTDNSGNKPRARITIQYAFTGESSAIFTRTVDCRGMDWLLL